MLILFKHSLTSLSRIQRPVYRRPNAPHRRQSVYLSPVKDSNPQFFALDLPGHTPPPAEQILTGVANRPKRKTVQTLKYWKGERPVYGRDARGITIDIPDVTQF